MCEVVKNFFQTGILSKEINEAIVALIPKSPGLRKWANLGLLVAAILSIK